MPEAIAITEERALGMRPEIGRWGFVVLGLTMNLCLGSVYAWSIFKPAVEKVFQATAFQGNLPFMTFLACFALMMFFGGGILERIGPRWAALLGGLVVGAGWLLSSRATDIWQLVFTYGVVAGSGVGLAYGCPVALGARWFPDRKGLAVGLMLAGFGGSALVTGRIAGQLIGDIKSLPVEALAASLSRTFLWFGLAFTVLLTLLSLPLRFPAAGWRPQGWGGPGLAAAAAAGFDRKAMTRTRTFWGLFLCYMIGCLAGLMAIGISKPVAAEVVKVSSTTATALVGLFALFNAAGRPLFGWLTDRLSPRWAAVLNLVIILAASLAMLRAGEGTTAVYVASFACFWLCLGGWLAIAPTATAAYFGMQHYSRNYGAVFFAYGLGAILGGFVSGNAKDMFGSYVYAFVPTAGLAAVGIGLAFALLAPPARPELPTAPLR
jgi:OFA family oxalate/formate antiporter-like MFS transporter